MKSTIIDITKATFWEENIDNDFQLELILIITYIKNCQPT